MALDGRTGDTLWEHRSPHEIFSLNCQVDLDKDGVQDCIGGGRAGVGWSLVENIEIIGFIMNRL